MKLKNVEISEIEAGQNHSTASDLQEIFDFELALVGGGVGDILLG